MSSSNRLSEKTNAAETLLGGRPLLPRFEVGRQLLGRDNQMKDTIEIDGATYRREHPSGSRYVVVLDGGWIFGGDLEDVGGRIQLSRAVNLRRYSEIGFEGAIADPGSDKVTIKRIQGMVDIPEGAELYRVPVGDEWGL